MELSIETMPIAFINNKQPNFGSSYKDILSIRVLVLLSISFFEEGDGIWETSQEKGDKDLLYVCRGGRTTYV